MAVLLLSSMACHRSGGVSSVKRPRPHQWIQVHMLFIGDTFSEVPNEMTVTLKSFDTPLPPPTPNSRVENEGFRVVAKLTNGELQTISDLDYTFSRAKTMNAARTVPYCISAVEWSGNIYTKAQFSSVSIYKKGKLVWEFAFPAPTSDIEIKVPNCDSPFFAKDGTLHT